MGSRPALPHDSPRWNWEHPPPRQQTPRSVLRVRPPSAGDSSRVARAPPAASDSTLEAQAITELKHAPEDSAVARCELGRVYQTDGKWTEARAELESCVRADPSPQNHYRLGLVYNRLGLVDLAQKEM